MTPYHFMSVIIRRAAKLKLSCESSVFVDSVSMCDTVGPYVKREIGHLIRNTAKKKQSRNILVKCVQSVKLS